MPQEKVIDGSICMSDDSVDPSILIVQMGYHLFVLDLNKGNEPKLLKTINFVEDHLPLNMGVMVLDKKFIMFGGQKAVKMYASGTDRFSIQLDDSFGEYPFEGAVNDVYELNTETWSLKKTDDVEQPLFPKVSPTVRYVSGKFFVLPEISTLRWPTPQYISEVYDPIANTWKLLPQYPQYCGKIIKSSSIPIYFFVGRRMYLQFNGGGEKTLIFCFNCETEEWEGENAINLRDSLEKSGRPFPDVGLCVSENIIINWDRETMWAYFIDDSGCILYYQYLDMLCRGIMGPCNHGFSLIGPKKSDGRFCLVSIKVRSNDTYTDCVYRMHIRHFELKETNCTASDDIQGGGSFPQSKRFLKVGSFENQLFTLPDVGDQVTTVWDAFFL